MKIVCSYRYLGAQGATDPLYVYQLQHSRTLCYREVCGIGILLSFLILTWNLVWIRSLAILIFDFFLCAF